MSEYQEDEMSTVMMLLLPLYRSASERAPGDENPLKFVGFILILPLF